MSELALYNNIMINASDDIKVNFNYQLINRFIDFTDVNNLTIKGYKTCIKHFIKWLVDNQIKQPQRADIKAYKNYLDKSNLSVGTKNQYLRAVKLLFKWLNSECIYPNIADNIKSFKVDYTKPKKDAFTEQDIKKIIDDVDTETLQGKRDKAILLLMLIGGLRINEVRLIDIQDIEIKNNQYIVNIQGKGHTEKDTFIKIIPKVYNAIKDYLDAKGNYKLSDALFTSTSNNSNNKRISREYLSTIIKNRFKNSGYDSKKLTAHSIRHTTATILLKASDNNIYKVQHHLRHTDPKTTEIYINLDNRLNDTSEQDIYNEVFNASEDKNNLKELKDSINNLTSDEVKDVLNYIKGLGGVKSDN